MNKNVEILYEDNHLLIVNKPCGLLVQEDSQTNESLENHLKLYIKERYNKAGAAFLGVVHRIDRPVSGAVLFAKSSKALVRLNEMLRNKQIKKSYWAVVKNQPPSKKGTLTNYIKRDVRKNKSYCYDKEVRDAKFASLHYAVIGHSDRFFLLQIELETGRHHQIRAQLSGIGCAIKGDLKYGFERSNPGGGIHLHSRHIEFIHPVTKELIVVKAPVPNDELWKYFEKGFEA